MFKSIVCSVLAASLVNAGTIPLGKLADVAKIGTQEEIIPYLGGAGPYFSFPGDYGISRDLPEGCEMKQLQMVGRHGERYPTFSKAKTHQENMVQVEQLHSPIQWFIDFFER